MRLASNDSKQVDRVKSTLWQQTQKPQLGWQQVTSTKKMNLHIPKSSQTNITPNNLKCNLILNRIKHHRTFTSETCTLTNTIPLFIVVAFVNVNCFDPVSQATLQLVILSICPLSEEQHFSCHEIFKPRDHEIPVASKPLRPPNHT